MFATFAAAALLIAPLMTAQARGPHRRPGWIWPGYYSHAMFPMTRTVTIDRTTTVNRTSRPERKQMALAYIMNNEKLTVSKYCSITGLDKAFAEAELDSFALDRKAPIVRSVEGKKIYYILGNDR